MEGLLLLAVEIVSSAAACTDMNGTIHFDDFICVKVVRAKEQFGDDEEVIGRYNRSLARIRQDLFFACGIWTLVPGLPPKNYPYTEKV